VPLTVTTLTSGKAAGEWLPPRPEGTFVRRASPQGR